MDEQHAIQQQMTEQAATTLPVWSSTSKYRSGALAQTLVVVLAVGVLLVMPLAACSTKPTEPRLLPSSGWRLISSPNPGLAHNGLNAVVAISASDVWAVGTFSNNGNSNVGRTLVEHWDGRQWNVVPSPNSQLTLNILSGVAAVSSNDVWAVGYFTNNSPYIFPIGSYTLIEHWNGKQWSIIPSPSPGATLNILSGVAAVSANDVWAVGYFSNSQISHYTLASAPTLIEHWNGKQWSIVQGPDTGLFVNVLSGVAAVSANDIWAVGGSFGTSTNNTGQTLVEHWNGARWSVVKSPGTEVPFSSLSGVTAVSASNIWAVGGSSSYNSSSNGLQTLITHWNGSQWSVVPSPNNSFATSNSLSEVAAVSATDVWAVGSSSRSYPVQGPALIERWNGSQWSIVKGQNPGSTSNNYLVGVAQVPGSHEIWAVGYYGSGDPERTITEVWSA